MILLIDNYDSFSYNLYQLVGTLEPDIKVVRNDELTVQEVKALKPKLIILSPGPGRPDQAGICEAVVRELGETIPILGVCLGHQAICEAYGGKIIHAKKLMHGKTSIAQLDNSGTLFAGMEEIMTGEATDAQKASFLTAMTMKGETIDEITSAAKVMRGHCEKFLNDMDVLEIVGTGGDGANTINISTIASIIVSSTGIPVAKHGNRAASSKCGTADCLEALGVNLNLSPAESAILLKEHNMCFLFAQKYHPAMRFVGAVRREIGIRTLFNVLGPLANPAGASMQLLGVYSESLVEPLARVLHNLGVKSAMVVYGQDGMDEISLSAPTTVCEVRNGNYKSYVITPEQFGFTRCKKEDLAGGDPQENAQFALDILNGAKGPKTDAVLLNAGAAIYTAREGITIEEGIEIARKALESGRAAKQLEDFARASVKG